MHIMHVCFYSTSTGWHIDNNSVAHVYNMYVDRILKIINNYHISSTFADSEDHNDNSTKPHEETLEQKQRNGTHVPKDKSL